MGYVPACAKLYINMIFFKILHMFLIIWMLQWMQVIVEAPAQGGGL